MSDKKEPHIVPALAALKAQWLKWFDGKEPGVEDVVRSALAFSAQHGRLACYAEGPHILIMEAGSFQERLELPLARTLLRSMCARSYGLCQEEGTLDGTASPYGGRGGVMVAGSTLVTVMYSNDNRQAIRLSLESAKAQEPKK